MRFYEFNRLNTEFSARLLILNPKTGRLIALEHRLHSKFRYIVIFAVENTKAVVAFQSIFSVTLISLGHNPVPRDEQSLKSLLYLTFARSTLLHRFTSLDYLSKKSKGQAPRLRKRIAIYHRNFHVSHVFIAFPYAFGLLSQSNDKRSESQYLRISLSERFRFSARSCKTALTLRLHRLVLIVQH